MPLGITVKCRLSLAFLAALILFVSRGFSDSHGNISLGHIGVDFGLPGGTVRAIGQDAQGVVWLGTEMAGLVSFDGSEFVAYTNDPGDSGSLSGNYIEAILVDSANRLWVGTINGANLFDRSTRQFTRFEEAEKAFDGGAVFAIEEDAEGNIWFGGDLQAGRLNPNTGEFKIYEAYDESGKVFPLRYLSMRRAANGQLRFGTHRGLFEYDAQRDRIQSSPFNALAEARNFDLRIASIAEDEKGDIWLSTMIGLVRYDPSGNVIERIELAADENQGTVSSTKVLVDREGVVWTGTFLDGVRILEPNTDESGSRSFDIVIPDSLKSEDVRSLYEDRNGLVWIGTEEHGVFIYDSKSGTFPRFSGSVVATVGSKRKSSHVRAILEDHEGMIWLGTLLDGIVGFDRETGTYTRLREEGAGEMGLHSNNTRAVIEDDTHTLWFGTPDGLLRFGPDRKSSARYKCKPIRELMASSDGFIYVGTQFGLLLFDPQKELFIPFPEVEGADKTKILTTEPSAMIEDSNGIIWLGTRNEGLFRYDPTNRRLKQYLPEENNSSSLNSKLIRSVIEDHNGNLWVGTKVGGLNRYLKETDSFERIGEKEGLPSETVYSIVDDQLGSLWLGMHDGVARYDIETGNVSAFTKEYGLQANRFDDLNAAIRSESGELVFGGRNGFNIFHPSEITKREQISNTILTSFKVLDEERIGQISDGKPFQITYDTNYITLSFALTDYTAPKRNEFAYLLEGFDEEWIYSGTRNYATYTELPAGRYTFRVKGKSPTGDWLETPYALSLVVTPPFWLTKTFMALSAAAVLGGSILIYGIIIMRSRWHRRRLEQLVEERTAKWQSANLLLEESKHSLESKVQERTKELVDANERAEEALVEAQKADQLKSAFLANMSHEIRTPMNAIIGFSSMLNDADLSNQNKLDFTTAIQKSSQELLTLVNDILDISMIEAGQVKLEKGEVDVLELLGSLKQSYKVALAELGKDKRVTLVWSNRAENPGRLITDETRLRQILSNFLSNAIKFTEEGTIEIGFEVEAGGQWIRFYVKDSGIGIEKELQEVIFDRFRKIEEVGERLYRGSGLGLSISRQLAEMLGGGVSVDSDPGKGATFYLRLPFLQVEDSPPDGVVARNGKAIAETQADTLAHSSNGSDEQPLLIVAEDEDSNFEVIVSMLRNENLRIVRAIDGFDVVETYRKNGEAKAILMDIKMPRMGGIEAARQIRADDRKVPIIAHTAHALASERSEIMNGDFDGYLSKPITQAQLIDCLKRYF